jgi:hypothetical protein
MLPLRTCDAAPAHLCTGKLHSGSSSRGLTGAVHMACRSCTLVREAVMAASARGAQPLLHDLLVEPSWQQVGVGRWVLRAMVLMQAACSSEGSTRETATRHSQ